MYKNKIHPYLRKHISIPSRQEKFASSFSLKTT